MISSQGAAVDVVIPVFNAADDLRRCVENVLSRTDGEYRLLLIDDASPDAAVRAYFSELESRRLAHLRLLVNASNSGFTLTANRGIEAARPHADVVLLN